MTQIIYECACASVPSPAKLSFIIKKNTNLKHKIHSFVYLTNLCRGGMTRAARIISTLKHEIQKQTEYDLEEERESKKNDCQA